MRPPACVSCKWGQGTACEKPSNTAAAKEVEAKLKAMQAERTKQDISWFAPPVEQNIDGQKKNVQNKTQ